MQTTMNEAKRSTAAHARKDTRIVTALESLIQGFDENNEPWKHVTTLMTVSPRGAAFRMDRPCPVGRLIQMSMNMPEELRAFDHNEPEYSVACLVQYCQWSAIDDVPGYNIGVAFVGKEPPESFVEDPSQSYRITGIGPAGMWDVTESETGFVERAAPRFRTYVDVTISLIKRHRSQTNHKEDTFTIDVSARGASVVCSLRAGIGDRVKFASPIHNFYAIAIVRNRRKLSDRTTLHLEFVDARYPVEKIPLFVSDDEQG